MVEQKIKLTSAEFDEVNMAVKRAYSIFAPVSMPFDLLESIDRLPNVGIASYQTMCDLLNLTQEQFLNKFRSNSTDAFIRRVTSSNESEEAYTIFYNSPAEGIYNPSDKNPGLARQRYSIAHELGHYFLGHLTDDRTQIDRLSEETYSTFEIQADFFASFFLVPPALVPDNLLVKESLLSYESALTPGVPVDKWSYSSEIFRVSYSAAMNSVSRLIREKWLHDKWHRLLPLNDVILTPKKQQRLDEYIPLYGDKGSRLPFLLNRRFSYCDNCNAVCACFSNTFRYCPVCGFDSVTDHTYDFIFYETKEQKMIDYPKYNVSGTPSRSSVECPRCGVSIIHANDFCEVCGTYLINRCAGQSLDGFTITNNRLGELYVGDNGWSEAIDTSSMALKTNIDLKGCNSPCSGKARFCSSCGSVTTYHIQNLFTYWPDERSALTSEIPND